MAFSKHRTNQTLAQRLDSLGPFWTQLKASRASYQAKLRALRTVARGLFGVASAPLGASQWLRHRRLAVQSLSFDKPGVNPQVLLGLVEAIADPEWLSILMTVSETRALCPLDFWAVDLYHAACGLLDPPPSSPTAVLLARIQKLGITVSADGFWHDVVGSYHPGMLNFAVIGFNCLCACSGVGIGLLLLPCPTGKTLAGWSMLMSRPPADACRACLQTNRHLWDWVWLVGFLPRTSMCTGMMAQVLVRKKWCGQLDSLEHRFSRFRTRSRPRGTDPDPSHFPFSFYSMASPPELFC